jgi:hypothetical protein
MKRRCRFCYALLGLLTALCVSLPMAGAQVLGDSAPPLLNTVAKVPLTVNLGSDNLFAPRLGLRVSGALYPLPLLLDRELNLDADADVIYTLRGGVGTFLANSSAALYAGAGPRYRLITSEIFLNGDDPGSYWGAGVVVGAEFSLGVLGLSLSAFAEAGGDYLWDADEGVSGGDFNPRVRVGLGIPLLGRVTF